VTVDSGINLIEKGVFAGCSSLESVTLAEGDWEISNGVETVTVTVTKDSGALIADYLVNEYKDYQWKQLSKYR